MKRLIPIAKAIELKKLGYSWQKIADHIPAKPPFKCTSVAAAVKSHYKSRRQPYPWAN